MNKENDVITYTHTRTHTHAYYSAINKKEILPFATTGGQWLDLEGVMLRDISQKDKYCMLSLI